MTNITLTFCQKRGLGHALLSSDDFQDLSATCQWRVRRFGVSASYLGAAGWQISPYSHTLEKVGADQFLLGPEIVQHMQPATNYIFKIVRPVEEDIDLVVAWRGIPSYRPGTDRVIFRSDGQADTSARSVPMPGTLELPSARSFFDIPPTTPPPPSPPPALPMPPPRPPEPIVPPLTQPPANVIAPMPIVAPTRAPAAPIERRLILCSNSDCRRQIVSSFTQCP